VTSEELAPWQRGERTDDVVDDLTVVDAVGQGVLAALLVVPDATLGQVLRSCRGQQAECLSGG
jgi:hypothetical protein